MLQQASRTIVYDLAQGQQEPAAMANSLGLISFINCLPVVLPLQEQKVQVNCPLVFGSPAQLNRAYAQNELNVGAMSSFYFLQNDDFELIPNLSISAQGPVASVLFFSRRHPRDLHGARIAVPACSATSVNLLRIYLNEEWNVSAKFETVADDHFKGQIEPSLLNDFDGFLVIGDRAIEIDSQSKVLTIDAASPTVSWNHWREDLAAWWHGRYRIPMVFGVWAAKRNWIIANEELFQTMCSSLQKAVSLGLGEMFESVLEEAEKRTGFSRGLLETYYKKNLNFELSERHLQGLELYRQLCVRHGLL